MMRHPDEIKNWGTQDYEEAREEHEKLQQDIKLSNSFPWNILAILAGIFQIFLMSVIAMINHLFKLWRVDDLDRELAKNYFYVPEMAIQKKIELSEFAKQELDGKGIDFGCGNGIVGGILIRSKGISDLHGVDLNSFNKDQVLRYGYANFTAADISLIPLDGDSFDYAISICVLEHVDRMLDALSEAHRLVRNGGEFVFTTPSPTYAISYLGYRLRQVFGLARSARKFARRRDLISMHIHYYSEKDWRRLLENKGFENIKITQIFSQKQGLWYEILNWQVYFPRFYFSDKLQTIGFRHPKFAKFAEWASANVTAALTNAKITKQQCTHFFISATVSKQIVVSKEISC